MSLEEPIQPKVRSFKAVSRPCSKCLFKWNGHKFSDMLKMKMCNLCLPAEKMERYTHIHICSVWGWFSTMCYMQKGSSLRWDVQAHTDRESALESFIPVLGPHRRGNHETAYMQVKLKEDVGANYMKAASLLIWYTHYDMYRLGGCNSKRGYALGELFCLFVHCKDISLRRMYPFEHIQDCLGF